MCMNIGDKIIDVTIQIQKIMTDINYNLNS